MSLKKKKKHPFINFVIYILNEIRLQKWKMFRNSLRSLRLPLSQRIISSRAPPLPKASFVRFYAGFPSLTRELARERVVEILEGYDKVKKDQEIKEDSSFTQDLGLDSLDVVEVVMELEHEFNIQIPDQEADGLKTVGQTIDYIMAQPDSS